MWFTNIIKPTHKCNLNCSYCYNEDTRNAVMSLGLLRRTIEQTFQYAYSLDAETAVDFIWHGGEPMMAGPRFYKEAMEIQKETCRGLKYANSIQTNGTLMDKEWIDFFSGQCFDVSLSIDGPEALHDGMRRYPDGRGSFKEVMRGIDMLRDAGIPHGVCVVVSKANKDRVDELFDFLSRERLPFNVIPITCSGGARRKFEKLGTTPKMYSEFWIELFDKWFDADEDKYVQCTDFIRKCRAVIYGKPADCIGQEQCANAHISTDPDGFVYSCATLSGSVDRAYGNLMDSALSGIMSSQKALAARNRASDPRCGKCKWQDICNGGCMSRSIKFYGTQDTRDYYCRGLYRIYEHIQSRLGAVSGLEKLMQPALVNTKKKLLIHA